MKVFTLGWEFISGLTKMKNSGTEIVPVLSPQLRFRRNIVKMSRILKVCLDLSYEADRLPLSSCFPRLLTSRYCSRVSLLVTVSHPQSVYAGSKILPRLTTAGRRKWL
jgi:hypothetical protein